MPLVQSLVPSIVALLLLVFMPLVTPCQANPGWGGGGWGGGYRGCCNPGGWYGTGIPNGLGWTMFGLAAAGGLAAGAAYAAPAPVVVESAPAAVQAPLVNYNGVLCYYVNGNYYPANPVK